MVESLQGVCSVAVCLGWTATGLWIYDIQLLHAGHRSGKFNVVIIIITSFLYKSGVMGVAVGYVVKRYIWCTF